MCVGWGVSQGHMNPIEEIEMWIKIKLCVCVCVYICAKSGYHTDVWIYSERLKCVSKWGCVCVCVWVCVYVSNLGCETDMWIELERLKRVSKWDCVCVCVWVCVYVCMFPNVGCETDMWIKSERLKNISKWCWYVYIELDMCKNDMSFHTFEVWRMTELGYIQIWCDILYIYQTRYIY